MLTPAWAALQSALNPLLFTAALVVLAGFVALYWSGRRSRQQRPHDAPDEVELVGDSDFALTTAPPSRANQAAVVLLPLAADLLVVDDSAVARTKLRRLFAASGYEVQQARDGVEALALLQKSRYRLMITDLEMPNLDGVALINTCQGQPHTASMPILAITGHDDLQARLNECQEICGIYRKPWIDEDLASHVALLLKQSELRQAEIVEP